MKILINTPMMGDKITELLTGYKENGVAFQFIQKTGMKMEFEVSGIEGQPAVDLVKGIIKSTEFGKVLYFSVSEG